MATMIQNSFNRPILNKQEFEELKKEMELLKLQIAALKEMKEIYLLLTSIESKNKLQILEKELENLTSQYLMIKDFF